MKLLSVGSNAKTIKSDKGGIYSTAILYLAPHKNSGVNLCPKASEGCAKACLYTAGRGAFSNVQAARLRKSRWFIEDRETFLMQLKLDIQQHVLTCKRKGVTPAVRLNGTSDILWERYIDMSEFPDVQFYDYTKWEPSDRKPKANYQLTYSRAEDTPDEYVVRLGNSGENVSVVFKTAKLPKTHLGLRVIDGDKDDLRFLDPKGVIVGLKAKGQAKKDTSGFAIDIVEVN